jgi:hypothetical protein
MVQGVAGFAKCFLCSRNEQSCVNEGCTLLPHVGTAFQKIYPDHAFLNVKAGSPYKKDEDRWAQRDPNIPIVETIHNIRPSPRAYPVVPGLESQKYLRDHAGDEVEEESVEEVVEPAVAKVEKAEVVEEAVVVKKEKTKVSCRLLVMAATDVLPSRPRPLLPSRGRPARRRRSLSR